jgi:hypothetical protein
MILFIIHKLNHSVWNKEELPDHWKESIIVRVHKKGDKMTVINFIQNVIEYPPLMVRSVHR